MAEPITTGTYQSEQDATKAGTGLPALWIERIKRAQKDEKNWRESAREAVKVYEAAQQKGDSQSAFNILHANIETTTPALYNSTPIPDVRRRFGDVDPAAKMAVDVIERGLSYEIDSYDFDSTVVEAVRDSELPGRSFVRVRYEPEVIERPGPDGQMQRAVGRQKMRCEHVIWDKWGHGPARAWHEVDWIYFEHDLTHDDLRQIGVAEDRIKRLAWDAEGGERDDASEKRSAGVWKTVRAYEIWDRKKREVLFVTEQDKGETLSPPQPDPIGLEGFFPGRPLQPLRSRQDITPLCPYTIYRPLVEELDKITRRIASLIGQLKVRGLYDRRLGPELERLRFCEDGQYEPADDAGVFASGGGLERAVAHWPMAETMGALKELYVQREQIKQTIYEVTGLSDVLRGATDPRETLGAQQLKAQSGSQRLSQRQSRIARFCRDLFRIKVEIMCKHYTSENLQQISGVQITPEVEQILRNDMVRCYRIDIETDSTIRSDIGRIQEQMTQFLQGTGQYAEAMVPVMQMAPGAKSAIVAIYAAFARNFKLGKSAEDALDQLVEAAQQPEPEKPNPEEQKMQAQMQMEQQKAQLQAQVEQGKAQREAEKMQADMAMQQQKMQLEVQKAQFDLQTQQQLAALKIEQAQVELQMKRDSMALEQQAKVFDIQSRREMSAQNLETRQVKADQNAEIRRARAEQQPAGAAE